MIENNELFDCSKQECEMKIDNIVEEKKGLKRPRKNPKNYINNESLTNAIKEWLEKRKENPKEPISNYIAEGILHIIKNYANKSNFRGYNTIEDMKSLATLNCCLYLHNFNPEKSNNAFAYITQIVHNAFILYITKENSLTAFKFDQVRESQPKMSKYDYNSGDMSDF